MSYMLFLDESGHDLRESPYEVLAGVAIEDRDLWNLICQIQDAEKEIFGVRVSDGLLELKGKKLLKTKTFRLASQMPDFPEDERRELARACLEDGASATRMQLTALAQAKLAFVSQLLTLCGRYRVKAFASIVDRDAPRPAGDFLRKDYAYLFERYFYYLDDRSGDPLGLVVFDELERSQCHILIDQMGCYFRETTTGQSRASKVIPEPFFVHSHLTTAIQIADVIAYLIAWGVRVGGMSRPARPELSALADQVCSLRYRTVISAKGRDDFHVWSFAVIDDLRPRSERENEFGQ
ncbi:MAG: DUF3800 domain-containing protein [Gammaproteobacteria bacterium]|nr:MAG: DUF3800 domain-containing protein [Gammaproteobacteria bacterium]